MARKPVEPLTAEALCARLGTELEGWTLSDGVIRRVYQTDGWSHTLMVANHIAFLAEAADHHPEMVLGWNRVEVRLRTHEPPGITGKDLELARRIEESIRWAPGPESALEGPASPFVEPGSA